MGVTTARQGFTDQQIDQRRGVVQKQHANDLLSLVQLVCTMRRVVMYAFCATVRLSAPQALTRNRSTRKRICKVRNKTNNDLCVAHCQ
jgi:hypothetical protein